jgi:single-strand DNA-binding protein
MKTQNRVQLIGYLGNDPVMGTATSGAQYAKIRMATDEYHKDSSGNAHRKATWHDIVAWDGLAATVSGNYIKGSHVLVEGRICHRTYEDKNGHLRYITEIKASTLINLDR